MVFHKVLNLIWLKVFLLATEAFSSTENNPNIPAGVMDEQQRYELEKKPIT